VNNAASFPGTHQTTVEALGLEARLEQMETRLQYVDADRARLKRENEEMKKEHEKMKRKYEQDRDTWMEAMRRVLDKG
jgi:predicted RNase H-like nuclease (RuvC/YqgF family)